MAYILVKDNMEKKSKYHFGNLKDALVELAIEQLDRGSTPQDLSVRSLAAELGVSVAAPYRHFPDARSFLAAVATKGFEMLALEMARENQVSLSILGQIYLRFASSHPNLYQAMYLLPRNELDDYPELATASRKAYGLLTEAVRNLQKSKGRQNLPEELATLAAWAYVHGLSELAVKKLAGTHVFRQEETLRILTSALLEGI